MVVSSSLFHSLMKVRYATTSASLYLHIDDYTGGELAVRHAGQESIFDWSYSGNDTPAAVKWAAFYSDCEHEVYEVTSGHRVTLTYNLFITRGAGHLAGAAPVLDSAQLPLYESLKGALDSPGFLRRG